MGAIPKAAAATTATKTVSEVIASKGRNSRPVGTRSGSSPAACAALAGSASGVSDSLAPLSSRPPNRKR